MTYHISRPESDLLDDYRADEEYPVILLHIERCSDNILVALDDVIRQ
jgi:hypothetical protein